MSDEHREIEAIADYLVDLVCDGPDETVKVPFDDDGNPIFDVEAAGLRVFRVECTREGEECIVAVAVGRPGELIR